MDKLRLLARQIGAIHSTVTGFATSFSTANLVVEEDSQAKRLKLVDGTTAPSATEGVAKIYVDIADGDLKIIFGDGTVKTIATDT